VGLSFEKFGADFAGLMPYLIPIKYNTSSNMISTECHSTRQAKTGGALQHQKRAKCTFMKAKQQSNLEAMFEHVKWMSFF